MEIRLDRTSWLERGHGVNPTWNVCSSLESCTGTEHQMRGRKTRDHRPNVVPRVEVPSSTLKLRRLSGPLIHGTCCCSPPRTAGLLQYFDDGPKASRLTNAPKKKKGVLTCTHPPQSSPGSRGSCFETSPRNLVLAWSLARIDANPLPHPLPDPYLSLDAGFFSCPAISADRPSGSGSGSGNDRGNRPRCAAILCGAVVSRPTISKNSTAPDLQVS